MQRKNYIIYILMVLILFSCGENKDKESDVPYPPLQASMNEIKCLLTPECLFFRYLLENEENEKCKRTGEWIILKGGSLLIEDYCANNRKFDLFYVKQGDADHISDDPNFVIPGNSLYTKSTLENEIYNIYAINKSIDSLENGDVFREISNQGYIKVEDNSNVTYACKSHDRSFMIIGVKK